MRAVAIVALVLAGCAPSLQGDGFYRCSRSSHCPSSAPTCGADGLCHASGVDAAMPTTDGGGDAATSPLTYPACSGDAPTTCSPDTCYWDPVLGFTHDGYCTRACTTDADCPSYDGARSGCIAGQCARGCNGAADCPDALACTAGRWLDPTLRLCVSLVAAEANWYDTCSIDGDCERPLSCIHGYCLRPCATSGDCIQDLEVCATSAIATRGCLYQCAMTSECSSLGGQCGGGGCHPDASW
jgi:hypothetical protein